LDSASKVPGHVAVHILAITMAVSRGLMTARYLVFLAFSGRLLSNLASHCGLFIWRSAPFHLDIQVP
jgi:hypothetical protein